MPNLDVLLPPQLILDSKLPLGTNVERLSDDSRQVRPGTLYFAVAGTQIDGHEFISQANTAGAVAVVVDRQDAFEKYPNAIRVHSVRSALAHACHAFADFPTRHTKLLGITGTNGKTTVAFLLSQLITQMGKRSGLIGTVGTFVADQSIESDLTTPGPVALNHLLKKMVDARVDCVAMEVSSIALDQDRIGGCEFEVAIYTNLSQDHLDYHGDFESYFQCKRKLFLPTISKYSVINIDDDYGVRLAAERTAVTVSLDTQQADYFLSDLQCDIFGTRGTLEVKQAQFPFEIGLLGRHNAYNALCAVAGCVLAGFSLGEVLAKLPRCKGAPGRLERVPSQKGAAVFVDYAHTPDALKNVLHILDELRGTTSAKLITVFGCGGDRDRAKRPLMGQIASEASDVIVVTSDNPRTEDPGAIIEDIVAGITGWKQGTHYREVDRRKAIFKALELAGPKDWVLIAGKGHEDYQILGTEKVPFDDRQIIRDYDS